MTQKRKNWKAQITLLSLLVLAIIIAELLTIKNSTLKFSNPIKLKYANLSISIPTGSNWKSRKNWKYQNNSFSLTSIFSPTPASITAIIKCRYLLAPQSPSADDVFLRKANQIDGKIIETYKVEVGNLIINRARIQKPNANFEALLATVLLANNHRLNIEFHYQANRSLKKPAQIFDGIIKSLKIEQQYLFNEATQIINALKAKGISSVLNNDKLQSFLLIKNYKNQPIGFAIEIIKKSIEKNKFNIKGASFFTVKEPYPQQESELIQSDDKFSDYIWKSNKSSQAGQKSTQIITHKDETLTVTNLLPPEETTLQASSNSIPEIFLDILLTQILQSKLKKCNVDIIESHGKIIPVIISKDEQPKSYSKENEPSYLLKMTRLDNTNINEEIYFDNQQTITKRIISPEATKDKQNSYILVRSTAKRLAEQFPENAELIINSEKLLR